MCKPNANTAAAEESPLCEACLAAVVDRPGVLCGYCEEEVNAYYDDRADREMSIDHGIDEDIDVSWYYGGD
jgi:hypothetical protein